MRITYRIIIFLLFTATSIKGEEVRIGLLIPDNTSLSAKHAAEMAIQEANRTGDSKGNHFKLVVRTTEGPWGAGSSESVKLIYEDGVSAIMGSLDGRNAHLAEQVATKGHILFLSAWAGDPTLSQAFVPWYFRCIPNDDQQAEVLYDAVFRQRKLSYPVIITDDSYDASMKSKSFMSLIFQNKQEQPEIYSWKQNIPSTESIIKAISGSSTGTDAILVFAEGPVVAEICKVLMENNIQLPVFTSFFKEASTVNHDKLLTLSPCHTSPARVKVFTEKFREMYGYEPGARAFYAYDGMQMIIQAVRTAGNDPERISEAMSTMVLDNGITGSIRFDDMGNRRDLPCLLEIDSN